MRTLGIDPGTVSLDLCGLLDGKVWLERSFPTRAALADPDGFCRMLTQDGPVDLIAGPSGYGLPLVRGEDLTEEQLRLAFLAPSGAEGGIGGLRRLARALARSGLPLVFTPGVIQLASVPSHRKLNRIDLGTADKVAAAALGIRTQADRLGIALDRTSFLLLELGGAFTAALAVDQGRIVDGIGGTSGPIGWRSSGAWDGETAFLAGTVEKDLLFRGGAGEEPASLEAYIEGAHKALLSLTASLPKPREILLSGRHAADPVVAEALLSRISAIAPPVSLRGFCSGVKQGAQGAALIADGLMGGAQAGLIDAMQLREARGSVLDWLRVIPVAEARARLGLDPEG
jgi:predicted butyrate kinase (DUF1464 family)